MYTLYIQCFCVSLPVPGPPLGIQDQSQKKIKNIRHFGYTSQRTSFISADIENDLHCESEVALGVCTVLYI